MKYAILHISDLHFGSGNFIEETRRETWFFNKVEELGRERSIPDCVIVSGDIFHQGKIDEEKAEIARAFFNKLRSYCSENCKIFAVPGNHDVDRNARKKAKGFNCYTERNGIIDKVSGKERFVLSTDDEKEVLYQNSFEAFIRFCSSVGIETFNDGEYELKVCKDSRKDDESEIAISVVLLNTSVLAGRTIRGAEFYKYLERKHESYKREENDSQEVSEAKRRLIIEKARERFVKEGGYVMDEEDVAGKNPRMNISGDVSRRFGGIRNEIPKNSFPVIVGHHSVDYFAPALKESFSEFERGLDGNYYLCGHIHETGSITNTATRNGNSVHITAGGLFDDKSRYAQFGFNIIELENQIETRGDVVRLSVVGIAKSYVYRQWSRGNDDKVWTENDQGRVGEVKVVISENANEQNERNSELTNEVKEEIDNTKTQYEETREIKLVEPQDEETRESNLLRRGR